MSVPEPIRRAQERLNALGLQDAAGRDRRRSALQFAAAKTPCRNVGIVYKEIWPARPADDTNVNLPVSGRVQDLALAMPRHGEALARHRLGPAS